MTFSAWLLLHRASLPGASAARLRRVPCVRGASGYTLVSPAAGQSGVFRPGRCVVTALSLSELFPLVCRDCGTVVPPDDDAALVVCPSCGLAHELVDGELGVTTPLVAACTTELAILGEVHRLAAWRLIVEVDEPGDSTWERLGRKAAPQIPYLYVPAFSTTRSVLHRVGFQLTQAQPRLEPCPSGRAATEHGHLDPEPGMSATGLHSVSAGAGPASCLARGATSFSPEDDESGFGRFTPVLLSRQDARILSHFLYLVLRAGDIRELAVADYQLDVVAEELVYIPAVWDTRYLHGANWRLLLREFDDLVA